MLMFFSIKCKKTQLAMAFTQGHSISENAQMNVYSYVVGYSHEI